MRSEKQLGKIDQATPLAGLLVRRIDPHHGFDIQITLGCLYMTRSQSFVFLPVNEPLRLLRGPASLIKLKLATDSFHDPQLVIAIENLKLLG